MSNGMLLNQEFYFLMYSEGIKKASFSDACVFRYSFFKLRRRNQL